MSPEAGIEQAALCDLRARGLEVDSIQWDAGIVPCRTVDKPHAKNGRYTAHSDAPVSVQWWNWATDESGKWTAKGESKLTVAERETLKRRMEADRKAREEAQAQIHAEAATRAKRIYDAAVPCPCDANAYLERKGVKPVDGLKLFADPAMDTLIVPVFNEQGALVGLQFIPPGQGEKKRFLTGTDKAGHFFPIGGKDTSKPLLICEGVATGISLHKCLELPVLVAFDAGNLLPVSELARHKYPERQIVLCADYDDPSKGHPDAGGIGLAKATAAALAVDGFIAVPCYEGRKVDWNDLHRVMGAGEVREQFVNHWKPEAGPEEQPAMEESRILPPPPAVPLGAFPPAVAAMMEEAAEAFIVPMQIVTASFLAFLSCLVGRSRLISIKAGWEEPGNLWIASVAKSGMGKSPCMAAFFKVVTRLEYKAKQTFDEAYSTYETEMAFYQAKRTLRAKDKAKGKEIDCADLLKPEEPKQRQTTADDVTVEALGDILQTNPKGILWLKDELSGMLFDLDKYSNNGGGGTKARLLSSHSLGPWKTNRSSNPGRNSFIPKACVGIFGGIQPGMMSKVFEAGAGGVDEESGFLPRFLFIRAVAEAPAYFSDRVFSRESIELLESIALALWPWDIEYDAEGREMEKIVPVSRQAKALYVEWYNVIAAEAFLSQNAALLRKLQAHALRLCLLLHSLDAALTGTAGTTLVTEDTMRRALLLADWVKEHQEQCRRFFQPEKSAKQADPVERAIMQVVVEQADRIEKDGWRISNTDLCAGVERILNMPGLSKEKIGKAASGLGLTSSLIGERRLRGRLVTQEKINTFKATVSPVSPVSYRSAPKTSGRDSTVSEPSQNRLTPLPAWAEETEARQYRDSCETVPSQPETLAPQQVETGETVETVPQGKNPEFDFNDPDFPDEVTI